jgi:c-di-GMP-binding flagellar brake protein YcgR
MENRRIAPRANVSFPVECTSLTHKGYFYTVSKDLSMGGIKILTNDFLPKDDVVKVNINLIDRIVNLKAKVMWCNKERVSDRYSAGLRFTEVNNINKASLSQFLGKIFNA